MTILKIILNALATAAIGTFVGGLGSFFHVVVTKPKEAAAGAAVLQGFLTGMTAAVVGLILGVAGSLLFPDAYPKILGVVLLLIVVLAWLAWRIH